VNAPLTRHQLRYLWHTRWLTLAYVVVPFVLIAYFRNGYAEYLRSEGYRTVGADEQVVPGTFTLYMFLTTAHVGFFTYGEHLWNTWDRVRAVTPIRSVVATKLSILWLHLFVQSVLIMVGSAVLFAFPLARALVILLPVVATTTAMVVGWAAMGYVACRTIEAFEAWCYSGAVIIAALGGGIAPVGLLPDVVQRIAPVSPVYWTMRAFRSVLLEGEGFAATLQPLAVLFLYAAVFLLIAGLSFDPAIRRIGRLR
jgi:ABC-2 type transport system permease protein